MLCWEPLPGLELVVLHSDVLLRQEAEMRRRVFRSPLNGPEPDVFVWGLPNTERFFVGFSFAGLAAGFSRSRDSNKSIFCFNGETLCSVLRLRGGVRGRRTDCSLQRGAKLLDRDASEAIVPRFGLVADLGRESFDGQSESVLPESVSRRFVARAGREETVSLLGRSNFFRRLDILERGKLDRLKAPVLVN